MSNEGVLTREDFLYSRYLANLTCAEEILGNLERLFAEVKPNDERGSDALSFGCASVLHAIGMLDFIVSRISEIATPPPRLPGIVSAVEEKAMHILESRGPDFGRDVSRGFRIAQNSLQISLKEIIDGTYDYRSRQDAFLMDVTLARELPFYLSRGAARFGDEFPKEDYEREVAAFDPFLIEALPIAMKKLAKTDYVSEPPGFHPSGFWWRTKMWELLVAVVGEEKTWQYVPGWSEWGPKIGCRGPRPWAKGLDTRVKD